MSDYISQWWSVATAQASEISDWLVGIKNPELVLRQKAINNYTVVQLLVSGRGSAPSEEIIKSLLVMMRFGADLNHVPAKESGLLQASVLALAARHAPREVVEFLLDNGAIWSLNGDSNPSIAACSYMNAPVILEKLLQVKGPDPTFIQFAQTDYPANYHHDLTIQQLEWMNHIPNQDIKNKLVSLLARRKVIYFDSTANSAWADSACSTEVIFGLPVTAIDEEWQAKRALFASGTGTALRNEVHCSLKYKSRTSTSGLKEIVFEVSLPVNRDICQHRAMYYSNEYIAAQLSHEGHEEFSRQIEKMFDIPTAYSYAVILMLLLHVNDPTLVITSSTRWEVLRPLVLQSIAAPDWLNDVARTWAHYDCIKSGTV